MMYLLKKFRRLGFHGNLEQFHCNPKEFQREEVVGVVLMRGEKAFSEKKKVYKSHQIVMLYRVLYLVGGLLARCNRDNLLEGC